MHLNTEYINDTTVKMAISGEPAELKKIKEHVLKELGEKNADIPGFRKGKAPLALVEKQLNPNLIQAEFVEHVVNDLYIKAINQEKLRVTGQPKVTVQKNVPYDILALKEIGRE